MDETELKTWQALHTRAARGETLTSEEQMLYEAGEQQLDNEEQINFDIVELRQLRESIQRLEAENARLAERCRRNQTEIAGLEAKLNPQTRQALGVGA